ncbi:MAG: DUF3467 domain-containing protein [Actinomycetota bacterium]|nr:DUF3467 domain-containing protein [Actinomycetota bacterium]
MADENVQGEGEQPHEEKILRVHIPEQQLAGVWANFARVNHSEHEFTIDFVRIDYASAEENEVPGVLVARVGVSPLFVRQLIAALEGNWTKYAQKAMPKEVYGGDQPEEPES